jgi:hypothetical protein
VRILQKSFGMQHTELISGLALLDTSNLLFVYTRPLLALKWQERLYCG